MMSDKSGTTTSVICVDMGNGEVGIPLTDAIMTWMDLSIGDDVVMEVSAGSIIIRKAGNKP